MSTVRMPPPAVLVAGATAALTALTAAIGDAGLDRKLLALSRLRASQINGCASGVAAAAYQARQHGASSDQLDAVAAWRETPWFRDEERAALALTESVTRLADQLDPVPDRMWDTAATFFDCRELAVLLLNIAITNANNRLDAPTRQQAGTRHPATTERN